MIKKKLTVKQMSQKSENEAAKKYGGRTQIASGALSHSKGDIKTETFLIEDKVTAKGSYSIASSVWNKIRKQGLQIGRLPLLRVTINCTSQSETVIVMDETDFLAMMCELSNKK